MIQTECCPLCTGPSVFYCEDRHRRFLSCSVCSLVFTPREFYLSPEAEKEKYDCHENSPNDPRYRNFLNKMFQPMNDRLSPGSIGFDFGSGPGPTLSVMFEEVGHTMAIYDIFYADDPTVFDATYDFITTTEVIEHLQNPLEEMNRLWDCLKSGGYLGIMTKEVVDPQAFVTWHYKRDPTHICFYHHTSFCWLGEQWGVVPEFAGPDVAIFQKP